MIDNWYAVRCVFAAASASAYEERITVWLARDIDAAIQATEREALQYSEENDVEYLGLAQAFHLFEKPQSGTEIFSLIRRSTMEPEEYLDRFFDTGGEVQGSRWQS